MDHCGTRVTHLLPDLCKRNPFVAVDGEASLLQAVQRMMAKKSHRVAIEDGVGGLRDIITQSTVVRFLQENVNQLEEADKTVSELRLINPKVVTATLEESVFVAFQRVIESGESGIGVVDKNGELVNNISASDLKHFGGQDQDAFPLSSMFLSLDQFFLLKESAQRPLLSVQSSDSFRTLLNAFVQHSVHRLYVLDGHELKGVITLRAVLALFIH